MLQMDATREQWDADRNRFYEYVSSLTHHIRLQQGKLVCDRYDIEMRCFFSDVSIALAPYIRDPEHPATSPSLPAMVGVTPSMSFLTPSDPPALARAEGDLRHIGAHETFPRGPDQNHPHRRQRESM